MKNNTEKRPILELENVTMRFGGLTAVDRLGFTVYENEIVGLIGPNGAGKTTVFNCATQFYNDYEGHIRFHKADGEVVDLRSKPITDIVSLGIARTFQNIELVPDLSIIDNVVIGAHHMFKTGVWQHILKTKKAREEEKAWREKAVDILTFLNIAHLKDFYVAGQPYGILKKIEIARAMMSNPRLIILDEPAAGLTEYETDELEKLVYKLRDEFNVSILLIEHDMGFVMNICDRVCAINFGKFLAMDIPEKIQTHPDVKEAYLGSDAA